MYVFASFSTSEALEDTLSDLQVKLFTSQDLTLIPMETPVTPPSPPRMEAFDVVSMLGVCFSTLGVIYGSQLRYGPIIWGLIGLGAGALLAGLLYRVFGTKHSSATDKLQREYLLLVHCRSMEQLQSADAICRQHHPRKLGRHAPDQG